MMSMRLCLELNAGCLACRRLRACVEACNGGGNCMHRCQAASRPALLKAESAGVTAASS